MRHLSIKLLFLSIFLLYTNANAQDNKFSIGGAIGVGSFRGDFPSQTTFGTKIFLDAVSPFSVFSNFEFNFTYAQKIEKFLPGSYSYDHYSYFTSFGLSGIFKQMVNRRIFIGEGIGLIYLNDKSFNDIDTWNYGILISLFGGLDLNERFDLLLDIDYGITMNNTNASYLLVLIGTNYSF